MLYRAILSLDIGVMAGEIFDGCKLSKHAIDILVAEGIIDTVKAPPLSVIPGMETIVGVIGSENTHTFITTPDADLSKQLGCNLDGVKDGSFAMVISYSKTTDEALRRPPPCGGRGLK